MIILLHSPHANRESTINKGQVMTLSSKHILEGEGIQVTRRQQFRFSGGQCTRSRMSCERQSSH